MRFTADVKGGLHANYAPVISTVGPTIIDHNTRRAAQALAAKGEYAFRKIVETLAGAAPGAVATQPYGEIVASSELGGVRPVVTTNLVNRATTAADVTDVKNAITKLNALTFTPAPVYNGDQNPLGTR